MAGRPGALALPPECPTGASELRLHGAALGGVWWPPRRGGTPSAARRGGGGEGQWRPGGPWGIWVVGLGERSELGPL